MKGKILLLGAAGAVGYVYGAKAGRERYEEIVDAANRFSKDPRVQQAAETAKETAKEQAPVVKEKVAAAAGSAASTAKSTVSSQDTPDGAHSSEVKKAAEKTDAADQLNPESTHFQEKPYPQGDLP